MTSPDVYIISAARTPIGNFNGTLSKLSAAELGSAVIKEVLKRATVTGEEVDEVIMSQTLTAGQKQNPARQASIQGGCPFEVPAYLINMLCGSGIKTVHLGWQSIKNGDNKIVICGGQESMSMAQHTAFMRDPLKMGNVTFNDSLLNDLLVDAFNNIHMGETAEIIAEKYDVSRLEQDVFAAFSQNKAEIAQEAGYLEQEIVAVDVKSRNGIVKFEKDEYPKRKVLPEKLLELKPCFKKGGTVTPGNSSGLNDGAAAVLLMSEDEMKRRSLSPLAKVVGFAQVGVDPKLMGIAPVPAIRKLLTKINWTLDDVDIFEINEAFAAQAIAVINELGIDQLKVNIYGGAIALGHPICATGTRILVTLIYALKQNEKKRGIASLCVGSGMGVAIAIEIV